MSQKLSQNQWQKQDQKFVLSPRMLQDLRLLQCNSFELLDELQREMRENPLLEAEGSDKSSENMSQEESDAPESQLLSSDWAGYMETYGRDLAPAYSPNDLPPIENSLASKDNLFQYLLKQLRLSPLSATERRIGLELIGNIDERGYLDITVEQVADSIHQNPADVECVLKAVQEFEPIGIGARNLKECLLIQAKSLHPPNPLVKRILEDQFDRFVKGKVDRIAKRLEVPMNEVKQAAKIIRSFETRPGRAFTNHETSYIIPDVYIFKNESAYKVSLNDNGFPRLKVSSAFRQYLIDPTISSETKEHIRNKAREAMELINNIDRRRRTIQEVAESIAGYQRDFFDKGIDFLKPLTLQDVADDISKHKSTVSRAISNKYVHTPQGVFSFKYFFNSGIRKGTDEVATQAVKSAIKKIVDEEDPIKPISDKQITEHLCDQGHNIARRTVAEYRNALGIPSTVFRRRSL